MISLSRHIELLLLEHNCVIVPGLGGFIANTASAVYNDGPDGDKLFIPPYRTIAFNPQLQINDGLLVQSYMQAYDASYPDAYLQMEKEIDQLNMQLSILGEYKLEGIGTLHKSLGQNIVLTSPEAGILTPSLYGTYSFPIKSVAELIKERDIQNAASQTNIMPIQTELDLKVKEKHEEARKTEKENIIPLKPKAKKGKKKGHNNYWEELGIASAIAVIIFLICLIPNISSMNGSKDTVIAGIPHETTNLQPEGFTTEVPTDKNVTEDSNTQTQKTEVQAEDNKQNTQQEPKVQDNTTDKKEPKEAKELQKNYTIVLASCVTEQNSNILIKNLASLGFEEAKYVTMDNKTRVIYSAYATEKEAYSTLYALRKKNSAFKDAWIVKMN